MKHLKEYAFINQTKEKWLQNIRIHVASAISLTKH